MDPLEKSLRPCFADKSGQTQPPRFTACTQGYASGWSGCCGVRATIFGACQRRNRGSARGHGSLAASLNKAASMEIKKPRWALVATIGADQPGMGMTNRVMLAQG